MTAVDLDAIKARLAGIDAFPNEPNEWHYDDDGSLQARDYSGRLVASVEGVAELGLIANAPTDLAALVEEVERLREEVRYQIVTRDDQHDRRRIAEIERDAARSELADLRQRVEALADAYDDFEHDIVTCKSFSCADCTMKNVVHDLLDLLVDTEAERGEGR